LFPSVMWPESEPASCLLSYLDERRKEAEETMERVSLNQSDLVMKFGLSFGFYTYHICLEDCWDLFICRNKPNVDTPAMFLQLRSQYLWTEGTEQAIEKSLQRVMDFLAPFSITIRDCQENRIDYAFHTNYIQDPVNFFPLKHLKAMQVSKFSRWHVEGHFYDEQSKQDYLTLGRRTSNNIFIRCYEKTKEVVEMSYKQFFIWIWKLHGMISAFDAYVLEYAYMRKRWHAKEAGRLQFYLDYGQDEDTKELIRLYLSQGLSYQKLKALADELLPDVTIITNFEFQTKRKFYALLQLPNISSRTDYLKRIDNLIQLQPEIVNLLTTEVIRFVRWKGKYREVDRNDRPTADWWKRLQGATFHLFERESEHKLVRSYQRNLDLERQKKLTLNKIAVTALYLKGVDDDVSLQKSVIDLLSYLNDNDMHEFAGYKQKKSSEYRKRLEGLESPDIDSKYALIDKSNGETID